MRITDGTFDEDLDEGIDEPLNYNPFVPPTIPELQGFWRRSREIAGESGEGLAHDLLCEIVRSGTYFSQPPPTRRSKPPMNPYHLSETAYSGRCAFCTLEMIPPEPAESYIPPDPKERKKLFHPPCWKNFYTAHQDEDLGLWGHIDSPLPADPDVNDTTLEAPSEIYPPVPKKGKRVSREKTDLLVREIADLTLPDGKCRKEISRLLRDPAVRQFAHEHGVGRGTITSTFYDLRHRYRLSHGLPVRTSTRKPKAASQEPRRRWWTLGLRRA